MEFNSNLQVNGDLQMSQGNKLSCAVCPLRSVLTQGLLLRSSRDVHSGWLPTALLRDVVIFAPLTEYYKGQARQDLQV